MQHQNAQYQLLIESIESLLEKGRCQIAHSVNTILVYTYWQVGQHIVEYEQRGNQKAEYGSFLFEQLSKDLTARCGKGFSRSNLLYMRKFYLEFPKRETVSHVLCWSHYFEILKSDNALEIQFYTKQCEKEKWSVRELKRQMQSMLYHRILKCFVLIDLKRGEVNHQDVGQMNLYLNYFKKEINLPEDNDPIGIVLGAHKNQVLVEYAIESIDNQLFVSKYQLYLPEKKLIIEELKRHLGE